MYGTANRRLSEQYGLKVYLCIHHHEEWGGPEAVHRNIDISNMLKAKAQEAFKKRFPTLDFRNIFGKSFLEATRRQQASERKREDAPKGIRFIDTGVGEIDW